MATEDNNEPTRMHVWVLLILGTILSAILFALVSKNLNPERNLHFNVITFVNNKIVLFMIYMVAISIFLYLSGSLIFLIGTGKWIRKIGSFEARESKRNIRKALDMADILKEVVVELGGKNINILKENAELNVILKDLLGIEGIDGFLSEDIASKLRTIYLKKTPNGGD